MDVRNSMKYFESPSVPSVTPEGRKPGSASCWFTLPITSPNVVLVRSMSPLTRTTTCLSRCSIFVDARSDVKVATRPSGTSEPSVARTGMRWISSIELRSVTGYWTSTFTRPFQVRTFVAIAARTAVGGAIATKVRTWNGLVNVLVQYPVTDRNSIDEIQRIPVRATDGSLVPLGRVATFTSDRASTKIEHLDKQVVVRVNGDIDRTRTTLGEVIGRVNQQLALPGFLPSGVTLGTDGDSKYFMEFLTSMAFALVTSIALIYCLMVILYGSFVTPLVIMFSIPIALIGAFLALAITHQTINLFSGIGLVMLLGLVAKNGILLVDYANTLRKRGLTYVEAILTSGGTRLRPIVMTTAAMVFGMLPLALGKTEGAEIRQSMGIVLIGGLLSSLFLTLFLVPAMYVTTNRP